MKDGKVKVGGVYCIVIERGERYTKVLTPMHEILSVSNKDISMSAVDTAAQI